MNCEQVKINLVPYCCNEVTGEEKDAIDRHLASCPDCVAEYTRCGAAVFAIRENRSESSSVEVWPRVAVKIAARERGVPGWALAPALGLLVAGVLLFNPLLMSRQPVLQSDREVVKELEFLDDYELWENMDVLENMDIAV